MLKQQAIIAGYENLQTMVQTEQRCSWMRCIQTHAARLFAAAEEKIWRLSRQARQRINIHGRLIRDRETRMIEAETIDATSTIRLLEALKRCTRCCGIEDFLTMRAIITPGLCKIGLPSLAAGSAAFHPAYRPHLNPIERLWARCTSM